MRSDGWVERPEQLQRLQEMMTRAHADIVKDGPTWNSN